VVEVLIPIADIAVKEVFEDGIDERSDDTVEILELETLVGIIVIEEFEVVVDFEEVEIEIELELEELEREIEGGVEEVEELEVKEV